jgi:hypothetical protein
VVKGQTASLELQAGEARQWRPRDGPAAHRRRHRIVVDVYEQTYVRRAD